MSNPTQPHSIKRCRSLSLIGDIGTPAHRKSSKVPSQKVYRGRLSLGRVGAVAGRINRRKTRNDYSYLHADDDDDDYYLSRSQSSTQRPGSSPAFRCLAVIERASSSSSSTADCTKLNGSGSDVVFPDVAEDERNNLFRDLDNFLCADRYMSSKLTMANSSPGRTDQTFTIGSKKEQHRYGDVLWLILRAYFSGREVSGEQDAAFEMDALVCAKREERNEILEKVVRYTAIPVVEGLERLETNYMSHLRATRKEVNELLTEFEKYQALFPHSKAMEDDCCKRKGAAFTKQLLDKVTLLTTWLNTVEDLASKIAQLGTVFEVSRVPDGEKHWPRPLHSSSSTVGLRDARPVFEAFVKRSLLLRGMKRVVARVWELCERTIMKTAILLQPPIASYAHAASRQRTMLRLTSVQMERYSEMFNYTLTSEKAKAVRLPSVGPMFIFVLGVRLELAREWLSVRSKWKIPDGAEMDILTMETLIEDCRDCVDEAVRAKLFFLDVIQSICPKGRKGKLCTADFENTLKDVFEKYLGYVERWCDSTAQSGDLGRLFSRLEEEWRTAFQCSLHIHSGLDMLATSFCTYFPHLLNELVVKFWETSMENISEKHGIREPEDDRSFDDTDNGYDSQTREQTNVFSAFRAYNSVIREVKERSARIVCLLRGALSDLHDASGYVMTQPLEDVLAALRPDYCLVDFGEEAVAVCVLIDSASADKALAQDLVTALAEGRKPDYGRIIVFPKQELRWLWNYRRVKLTLEENVMENIHYLRTDVVCAVGMDCKLEKRYPGMFELVLTSCSSHYNVDRELKKLAEAFLELTDIFSCGISVLCIDVRRTYDSIKMRDSVYWTLIQAFNFAFQLHREVCRYVGDSYLADFGMQLVSRGLDVIHQWKELIAVMKPQPSPHIPLWASHAFNFIHFLTDPKYTEYLLDYQFQVLKADVEECKRLVLGDKDAITVTPRSRSSTMSSRKTSDEISSKMKKVSLESRRARLEAAALETDEKVAKRSVFRMGRVITLKREDFKIENYTDPSRTAPFKYQILEKLAGGTFGTVYKALNVDAQCVIAVKEIRVRRDVLKILKGEVDIFRNLSHKNLVKYYGCEVRQDEVLIMMEYCSEGTLEKICREGLDEELVRRYTNSLLRAVAYMHSQKVVHRDIKPANIFLDLHCVLKLGDFGCSVRLRDQATVYGEIAEYAGTVQYMAPEVLTYGGMAEDGKYRGYGRAVDIWSIGCVVLEMSTGRRPWPDMHPFQITMKVCQGVLPAYPNPIRWILKHFLDSCFVFNPDDRKSAEQLLHDPFADVHVDADSVIPSLIAQDDNDGENKPLSWQTSNQGDNIDNHGSGSRGSGSSGCNSSSS
uniref:Protein kinase domain-containing protein n=1 Tax=Haemonchus contortus TaxID=6289 RepID=A0A7I4XY50_HAECO